MIDCPKNNEHRRDRHNHMEMSNHKVGVRKRQVDGDITQEQTSQTTINECENEANCEQHGDSQLDVTPP